MLLLMKKLIIPVLLAILLLTGCQQTTPKDKNFRQTSWGDSKQTVTKSEETDPIKDRENMLVYENLKFIGFDAVVTYNFIQDKLSSAEYDFTQVYPDYANNIDTFDLIRAELTETYGSPTENRQVWKDGIPTSDPIGLALALGDVSYAAYWNLEDTEISLSLSGYNLVVDMTLTFISKEITE